MSVRALIVVGPQGCGKSQLAKTLAELYRLEHVLDGWDGRLPTQQTLTMVPGGCLVVSNVEHLPELAAGVRVLPFDEAKSLVETLQPAA